MRPQHRRSIGLAIGGVLAVTTVVILSRPGCATFHAPGPMNQGHAAVECSSCHRPAPGTLRQQLQTAARTTLGMSGASVDVGYRAVGNDECLACHNRPADRHPAFRFLEPRFAAARAEGHPEQCTSCHAEHRGVRVTRVDLGFCRHCHEDTKLADDPLDVPHATLVASKLWTTCIGCHDFHGNHEAAPPTRLDAAIPLPVIQHYFAGGASPYGPPLVPALREVPPP